MYIVYFNHLSEFGHMNYALRGPDNHLLTFDTLQDARDYVESVEMEEQIRTRCLTVALKEEIDEQTYYYDSEGSMFMFDFINIGRA